MLVGIDLGTTNSLIGFFGDNGPELIPNALGEYLTPSVLSVDEKGTLLVGRAARDRLVTHPHGTVAAFKRWMGTARETRIGNKNYRPEEFSALVLRSLLDDAEAHLGEKITEAIISVPAYFGDAQRKATRAAGELAGIRVERLINEPTAAALAYGLEQRMNGSTFIVLDLGGGTFDVSILEIFDGVMQVHASAGDNNLGGEDFLHLLIKTCCTDLGIDQNKIKKEELAQIESKCERAKKQLSTQQEASLEVMVNGEVKQWTIHQDRFESLAEPLIQRIRHPIERAMRDAKLLPNQLDEVILVGGSSRLSLMSKLVARMLGRLPLRHVDPDRAIAMGACVVAGMKARNVALEEIVMTDVCPYTLGVEISRQDHGKQISHGHFSPIIERNSTVPVSRSSTYSPMHEGQVKLELNVYQGESPLVANNVKLGRLEVALSPRLSKEDNSVDVRFTYDVNGVLQVEATVLATKKSYELILQENKGVLTDAEIRARLESLAEIKIHPRQDQENIAAIAKAERIYAECLGQDRDEIQHYLVQFLGEIDRQDRHTIAKHREQFNKVLADFEARLGW